MTSQSTRMRIILSSVLASLMMGTSAYAFVTAASGAGNEPSGYGCCLINCTGCPDVRYACNPNIVGHCLELLLPGTKYVECCVYSEPE
jgi:hypothetical protein